MDKRAQQCMYLHNSNALRCSQADPLPLSAVEVCTRSPEMVHSCTIERCLCFFPLDPFAPEMLYFHNCLLYGIAGVNETLPMRRSFKMVVQVRRLLEWLLRPGPPEQREADLWLTS